jgi:hypothetical protein
MREQIKIDPCLTNKDLLKLKSQGYKIKRLDNGKFVAEIDLSITQNGGCCHVS